MLSPRRPAVVGNCAQDELTLHVKPIKFGKRVFKALDGVRVPCPPFEVCTAIRWAPDELILPPRCHVGMPTIALARADGPIDYVNHRRPGA